MDVLKQEILQIPEIQELLAALERGGWPAVMGGTSPVHRAVLASALSSCSRRPLLLVCCDEKECRQMAADLQVLTGSTPILLAGREWQFRPGTVSREWELQRISAFHALLTQDSPVVVATLEGLVQRTLPPTLLRSLTLTLRLGQRQDPAQLVEMLLHSGYVRCQQVEGVGQFAVRGGIYDIYSPGAEGPVRIEFFDDEIDSMGIFDTVSQRRSRNIEEICLLPAAEVLPLAPQAQAVPLAETLQAIQQRLLRKKDTEALCRTLSADRELLQNGVLPAPDRYLALLYAAFSTAMDYLPPDALLFLCDSPRLTEQLKAIHWQWREDSRSLMEQGLLCGEAAELLLSAEDFAARLQEFATCFLDALPVSHYLVPPKVLLSLQARQLSSYGGSLEAAASDLEGYRRQGTRILVLCGSEGRAMNLHRLLRERNIVSALDFRLSALPKAGEIRIAVGALSAGAEYSALSLVVLTEGQLTQNFQKKPKRAPAGEKQTRQKLQSFTDLSPGDLVVHAHHGIGRFVGIQRMPVDGVEKDYIKIAYAGNDCLYVPATALHLVSKYIGGGEDTEHTRLHKLGGTEWHRSKSRAKSAVKDLAEGLIRLYAQRQRQKGFAFSPDSPWQQEFEAAFPFEETEDQLRCVQEIKRDMERPVPMDRLLCGDVGYGKTEVAFRAIMKCVMDGKQAAILVPTTVLAQQHYATALNRFRNYPVNIAVLSRFQSPAQCRATLEQLRQGSIDLLIGTHKLLQKGLEFKDLGLLVVDEEQRFGVSHKEKLKELARQVDVLTLTATPIPRTLNMALSGIRDLSMLEQPPLNRQPVQTYVLEHDWVVLAEAMRRELARGGQIYYLHNRVDTIDRTAERIRTLLGESVSVIVGHGQMNEGQLSSVMQQMVDGEAQVLVCTTIIETGIDIPNVNTLIIEDADHMGLSQLHQLRGRIGRSARRAYAYMTFRTGKVLTEVAEKRLTAIREYVEFGAGFKIAMRDLEIRGAGNLLGAEQSGYLMSVGYDMYLQLLEEAVLEEQGQSAAIRTQCTADLTVSANIPPQYVPSAEERMDLYRRIAAVDSGEDANELLDELLDRYGDAPKSVLALLDVALLRSVASRAGVSDLSQKGRDLVFTLERFSVEHLMNLCALPKYHQRISLSAGEIPRLTLHLRGKEDPLSAALELAEDLQLKNDAVTFPDVP